MIRPLVLSVCAALCATAGRAQGDRAALDLSEIRRVPVLSNGRYKPFDSYAREFVLEILGDFRATVVAPASDGGGEREVRLGDPMLTYLEWWFDRDAALNRRQILVGGYAAQKAIGVEAKRAGDRRLSYVELRDNRELAKRVADARGRQQGTWTPVETELMHLDARLRNFANEFLSGGDPIGGGPPLFPSFEPPRLKETFHWFRAAEAPPEFPAAGRAAAAEELKELRAAFLAVEAPRFLDASRRLRATLRGFGAPEYPAQDKLDREVALHRAAPFERAAWWYFGAFFLAVLAAVWRHPFLFGAAFLPGLYGLGLHVWGLYERTTLSGRALIGTFYESMLFVAACAFAFGAVLEVVFRSRWFLMSGAFLAFLGLWGAMIDPHFMKPGLSNLQPVLINNFWIHIHVPVIMASYAMTALSAIMGHVWLVMRLVLPAQDPRMREISRIQYWVLPPALILVFAGTILGGVWADQAWGRFWGWDPKEVGAFALMLAVAAVVHGRYAGWLRDFGTAVGALCCGFMLFVSYYGVNFFSSGLHSYAATAATDADKNFFAKIPLWVWGYVLGEIALILLVYFRTQRESRTWDPAVTSAS